MKIRMLLACALFYVVPSFVMADEGNQQKAVAAADEIVTMWSTLAKDFADPGVVINEESINKLIVTIRSRAREIYETEGLKIRWAATRTRNQASEANPVEMKALYEFDRNRNMRSKWVKMEIDGVKYTVYMKPIFIEESCLACHGKKENIPKIIVDNYPDDKAYNYKVGDLRGVIEVMYKDK